MLSLWGVAGAGALAVEVRGVPPVCWEEELLLEKTGDEVESGHY